MFGRRFNPFPPFSEESKETMIEEIKQNIRDCNSMMISEIHHIVKIHAEGKKRYDTWGKRIENLQKEVLYKDKVWDSFSKEEKQSTLLQYLPGFDKGETRDTFFMVLGNESGFASRNLNHFLRGREW